MYAGSAPQPSPETIDGSAVAALSAAGVGDAVGSWAVVVTPSESPRTVSRASGRSVLTRTATAPGADSRAPYVAPIERSRIGYIQRVLGRPTLVFVAAVTSSAT
jgi:hypothetical protein